MTSVEGRKYPRYEARVLAKCKELHDLNARWHTVQVKNISLGGMLFNVHKKFPISTNLLFRLEAYIKTRILDTGIIELRAKVLAVVKSTVGYDTRVVFIEDVVTESVLGQFLDCLS